MAASVLGNSNGDSVTTGDTRIIPFVGNMVAQEDLIVSGITGCVRSATLM